MAGRVTGVTWVGSHQRGLSLQGAGCLAFIVLSWLVPLSMGQAVTMFIVAGVYTNDETISNFISNSQNACSARCMANPSCGHFVYSSADKQCYLKWATEPNMYGDPSYSVGLKIGARVVTTPLSLSYLDLTATNQLYYRGDTLSSYSTMVLTYDVMQIGLGLLVSPVQILRDVNSRCQAASFSTSFSFLTHHVPTTSGAEGFTFFMSSSELSTDTLGGWNLNVGSGWTKFMGFVSSQGEVQRRPSAFAVEFDTFKSDDTGDQDDSHVGIDLNFNPQSVANVSTIPSRIFLQDYRLKYAWIDYNATENMLRVFLSYSPLKPSSPILSYPLNLCTLLRSPSCSTCGTTTTVYMGFSGSTGSPNMQSTHIFSWAFQSSWPANQTGTLPASSQCTFMTGCRFDGNDLPGYGALSSPSVSDCCNKCSNQPLCRAWTWRPIKKKCYLKTSGNNMVEPGGTSVYCGERARVVATTPLSISYTDFTNSSQAMFVFGYAVLAGSNIRLSYGQSQYAVALYQQPVQLLRDVNNTCEAASFNVTFTFDTSSEEGYDYGTYFGWGEGFTFMVLASNLAFHQLGNPSGSGPNLGFTLDTAALPGAVAVEFDTRTNDLQSATELSGDHVGINVRYSPISLAAALTNSTNVSLSDNQPKTAWIDYDARAKRMSVFLGYTNVKPRVPLLSQAMDMCQILRPADCLRRCATVTTAYIGFSASTSDYNLQYTEINTLSLTSSWPNGNIV